MQLDVRVYGHSSAEVVETVLGHQSSSTVMGLFLHEPLFRVSRADYAGVG